MKNKLLCACSLILIMGTVLLGGCTNVFSPSVASDSGTNTALPVPPLGTLTTNIAFTGICSNGQNAFAFMALQTLTPSDTIYFTTQPWDATLAPPGFSTVAGSTISFTPAQTLPAGTQMLVTQASNAVSIIYNSSVTGVAGVLGGGALGFGLKKYTVFIIAYQIPSAGTTQMLTAMNENSASPWLTSGPVSKGFSYLPPGLNYQNSIDLFSKQGENIVFSDCNDVQYPYKISATSLLALLVYPVNWTVGPSGGSTLMPGTNVAMCDFTAAIQ